MTFTLFKRALLLSKIPYSCLCESFPAANSWSCNILVFLTQIFHDTSWIKLKQSCAFVALKGWSMNNIQIQSWQVVVFTHVLSLEENHPLVQSSHLIWFYNICMWVAFKELLIIKASMSLDKVLSPLNPSMIFCIMNLSFSKNEKDRSYLFLEYCVTLLFGTCISWAFIFLFLFFQRKILFLVLKEDQKNEIRFE